MVAVLAGKYRGKRGTVLIVGSGRVMVEGVHIVKRHQKARKQGEKSAIVSREAYIALSNVMPVCPGCKKPCRINVAQEADRQVRLCNRCKEAF